MIEPSRDHISVILDLTRLNKKLIPNALPNVYVIGKEVDLLETIRRTDKKDEMNEQLLDWHAIALGLTLNELKYFKQSFIDYKMISFDEKRVELLYSNSDEVYLYGINRAKEIITEKEILLIDYISKTMKKPRISNELLEILDLYDNPFNKLLEEFLVENNIISPFDNQNELFYVSPRIYKDEKLFKTAYEILEDYKLTHILDFLKENPGNPSIVVQQHLGANSNIIDVLNKCGILDPLKLNVQGDPKTYLFSTDCLLEKKDKDYFDLVKMTLANFRYGEYYSRKSRLTKLDDFLSSMIDRGFAGKATAIGTDYKNLELAGIIKIQKVTGDKYMFWMLKKDVIEGARSILRGYVPITSGLSVGEITNIENIVKTRSMVDINLTEISKENIVRAIRHIQEEIT